MDFLSPITEIVSRVIDCSTKHLHYLRKLEKKLNKLNEKMEELNEIKSDVNNKVLAAEAQLMVRTSQVSGWMQRVEAKRLEVEQISLEGTQHLERRCLNGCCPRNCWSSYKLGKKAVRKVLDVEELKCNGVFDSVAENPPLVVTRELPEVTPIVGLDSIFDRAWNFLGENSVRIMGLYGMGGVGKTTLLKRINNELSKRGSDFNIVIWLVISKEVNMARVQEEIGNKLGLSLSNTENIFNLLKTKRFLLLLDDIWQRIDLVSIGVPLPSSQNNSKILFTTRSETVCGRMEADKIIRVECLNWEAAWTLFQEKVGYKALNSDVDIPRLAKIVAKECLGLPLALITIGRSMASKKTCHEWEHAISVLKNSAAEFPDIKSLPYEMRNLTKLKYLSLRNQKNITTYEIPHGIITNLLNLEFLMLDVKKSEYPNGSFEIDELWCLNNLKYLEIRFFSDSKDVGKFLNYHKLANCARKLSILTYKDITSLSLSASSSSSTDLCLGHLKGLENLCIYDCSEIKELRLNKETIEFESLQRMDLINLPKLIISWDANNLHLGSHFRKLICLQLDGCGAMVDLTWLLLIPNLQSLWIESCNSLEEILSGTAYDQNTTFLNLQFLRLKYLPNLQSICSMSALPFRSLNTLVVHESPKLKRLPLDLNSAKNTLQKIGARQVWWDGLEWENETIKTHFAKFLSSPF
ncbi:Disease resistance protein summ2 [Thalictrum thalictroides]|uniref:Disease resistance protein summ2 n=1 Tax=Thalictrum thalictroides TaxID=46969 RepID=A0A7J6V097_THATH|nr:Disease resistance protein summ2 [Thalictrum thalictroides]